MRFSLRNCFLLLTVATTMFFLVGRMTKDGVIIVSQKNLPYVESVLARNKMYSWGATTSMGGAIVYISNPWALTKVDRMIVDDAEKHGYCIKIHYHALLPYLSSEKTINREMGLFGK